jgi:hypothetical protein
VALDAGGAGLAAAVGVADRLCAEQRGPVDRGARFASELEVASTSRMWQLGQIAETMSTSSEISSAQPTSDGGGAVPPFLFTLRKQRLAVVHAAMPNRARYWFRSDSALGSSNASTMPMVCPAPPVAESL